MSQTRRKVSAARSITLVSASFSRSCTMSTPPSSAAFSSGSGSFPFGAASQTK